MDIRSRQDTPERQNRPQEGGKKTKSRNRSSTGCLTCRRRKKKCDEKSYPQCLTCQDKDLKCEWPSKVNEIHKHLSNVRYYGADESVKEVKSRKKSIGKDVRHQPRQKPGLIATNVDDVFDLADGRATGIWDDVTKDLQSQLQRDLPIHQPQEQSVQQQHLHGIQDGRVPFNFPQDSYEVEARTKDVLKRIALQQDCVDDI